MNIEEMRDYCLSFEGVTEKTPVGKFAPRFDSVLVFYVCDRMFCLLDMDDFVGVTVKGNPETIAELMETRSSCQTHRNMSPKHWIQLNHGGDITDAEIFSLVEQSYNIVKAKYTRRSRI